MANKIGRNAPCPCGSGQKYKRCCGTSPPAPRPHLDSFADYEAVELEIDRLSNRVPDLMEQGQLDEALDACHELRRRYPDEIDWLERFAEVHEARGEPQEAADYYYALRDGTFDPEYIQSMAEHADRLDPREPDPQR